MAGGRALVVRVFPGDRPMERVRGDLAILAHAAASGIPAERPVAVAALDGRGVIVTEYVPGRRLARTAAGLRRLGDIAGRLSSLAPHEGDPYLGRSAGSLPVEDLSQARAELARIEAAVPANGRDRFAALVAAVEATHDCQELPRALIHPDCQITNAIQDRRGGVRVIDWEGAGIGPRLVPLGLALFSAVVQAADEPAVRATGEVRGAVGGSRLDLGRVVPIVEGFVEHGAVDAQERDRLPDLIRFRPVAIAVRMFSRAIREGRPLDAPGWWSRFQEADLVAARARAELGRIGRLRRAPARGS